MLILPLCHAQGDGAFCAQGSRTASPGDGQTWHGDGIMAGTEGDELSTAITSNQPGCLLVKSFYAHQVLDLVISGLVQALLCFKGQTVRHFLKSFIFVHSSWFLLEDLRQRDETSRGPRAGKSPPKPWVKQANVAFCSEMTVGTATGTGSFWESISAPLGQGFQ